MLAPAPSKKPCTLNSKVQSLLELICDLKAMEECVLEMKFDTKKAPLGQCVYLFFQTDVLNDEHVVDGM